MNLSGIFNVDNAAELKSGKALNDPTLLSDPVKLSASKELSFSKGGFTFSIKPESSLEVALFNQTTDIDPDGLINSKAPIITLDPTQAAYLKYSLNVGATGTAGGNAGGFALDLNVSKIFTTGLYKKHDPTDKVPLTIVSDISSFLSIFDWTSVAALNAGDALFTSAKGKLEGKLGFSWTDIFTQSMSALTKLLPADLTLDIKLSPSVSASFSASVEDNYLCAMKRMGDDSLLVTISKVKSSSVAGEIGASIGIQFADPDVLEAQLNAIVDQVLASVTSYAGNIAQLIQKFQTNTLSPAEKEILDGILKRLKLDALADPVASLTSFIENLRTKAMSTTKAIAHASASLSFEYEYSRISENEELLSVQISQELLETLHPKLIGFKTDTLLSEVKANTPGITLNNYLNRKTLTVNKSWGLGLSLLGAPVFSGKTIKKKISASQTNMQGQQQNSLDQIIGYQREWMGESTDWVTDFNAKMPAFSASATPTLNEFDLSFYVQMTSGMKVRKEKHLQELLDIGVMWGAINESELPRIIEKYMPMVKKQVVTTEAKMTFKPTAMLAMIQQLGQLGWNNATIGILSKAMASSMSYWNNFPLRQSVSKRTDAYTGVWQAYLTDADKPLSYFADLSKQYLQQYGNVAPMLVSKEGQAGSSPNDNYAANVMYMNPSTAADAQAFVKGLSLLKEGIAGNQTFNDSFQTAYQNMSQFFSQSFYVRTLGCLLNEFTQANPGIDGFSERVFTISWGEGAEAQTVSLASKN